MTNRRSNKDRRTIHDTWLDRLTTWLPFVLLLCAATQIIQISAAQESSDHSDSSASNRLTVAILGFANKTGDPEVDNWRPVIEGILGSVREVRALRCLGRSSIKYGLLQIQKREGEPLTESEARKVGELIEARRVIWGDYQRRDKEWRVNVHVLNVATGVGSTKSYSITTNWFALQDEPLEGILRDLAVRPSAAERRRTKRDCAPSVLEWLGKGGVLWDKGVDWPQLEEIARRAVAADTNCARAHNFLGAILANQGKFGETEAALRQAIRLDPESAGTRQTLGTTLFIQGKVDQAEEELSAAARLDSDDPETQVRLGEINMSRELTGLAVMHFKRAVELSPHSALLC